MNELSPLEIYKLEMCGNRNRDLGRILEGSGINPALTDIAIDVCDSLVRGGRPIRSGENGIEVNIIPGCGATNTTPYLVVYCGDTDQLHKRLLDMILYLYPRTDRVKEVLVVTRKWDSKSYLKVEDNLFDLVKWNGVKIVIILETDYGFTRIPISYMKYE